jgi:cell division protein FtsW
MLRRRGPTQAVAAPALDYPLIAIVVTLLGLGLFMVYSASFPTRDSYYFTRQLQWVALGVVACVTVAAIPYQFWRKVAVPLMVVTLLALIAVLIYGDVEFGAKRTLLHGRFQPSEFAKFAVAVYVAAWVAARRGKMTDMRDGLLPFVIIMGLVAGLIALEKSFSVTIIVLIIGLAIFFVGGGNGKQVLLIGAVGAPMLIIAMWQSKYALDRAQDWYAVYFDPSKVSQAASRILEMARSGQGIGTDISYWQSKLGVPALWSDYLFANIGADLHFVGMLLVVALYIWLAYRGLVIALNTPDRFAALTAIGLTIWITVQAVVHIGASLMLIPTTGQPLPFMSYGGSSLLSCMVAAGLLLSISRSEPEKKAVYAHFGFGWRDWRPRLPHPRRRQRVEGDRPLRARKADARPAGRRNTAAANYPKRTSGGKGASRKNANRTGTRR